MPLPLAMMIPFMGIQSAVMAKQFGENFQYGKRRISAMSNDEFNKLTPKMIQDNANKELKAMIPSMEQSVVEMRTFQTFLIREFLRTLNDAIKAGFGELFGINDETLSNIEHYLHGHGGGHNGGDPTPTPEHDHDEHEHRPNPKDKDKPESRLFIPPVLNISNLSNEPTNKAIGWIKKIDANRQKGTAAGYQVLVHQLKNPDKWVFATNTFIQYKLREPAMTRAAQFWPSPKFFPNFRGNSVYYFRIK